MASSIMLHTVIVYSNATVCRQCDLLLTNSVIDAASISIVLSGKLQMTSTIHAHCTFIIVPDCVTV